jgi:hypothetical protein
MKVVDIQTKYENTHHFRSQTAGRVRILFLNLKVAIDIPQNSQHTRYPSRVFAVLLHVFISEKQLRNIK